MRQRLTSSEYGTQNSEGTRKSLHSMLLQASSNSSVSSSVARLTSKKPRQLLIRSRHCGRASSPSSSSNTSRRKRSLTTPRLAFRRHSRIRVSCSTIRTPTPNRHTSRIWPLWSRKPTRDLRSRKTVLTKTVRS